MAQDTPRRRRSAKAAQSDALAAAREILIADGPGAVTLKAVGDKIGVTHANLIHHFGSAEGLQGALMTAMIEDLAAAIDQALARLLADPAASPRTLVDVVFDAFERGGAGPLAAWLSIRRNRTPYEPAREAVRRLVASIEARLPPEGATESERVRSAFLFLAVSAFGDAVIGPMLRVVLARQPEATREIAARLLPSVMA